eukprot:6554140-Prymnesium_polylepis.1
MICSAAALASSSLKGFRPPGSRRMCVSSSTESRPELSSSKSANALLRSSLVIGVGLLVSVDRPSSSTLFDWLRGTCRPTSASIASSSALSTSRSLPRA